MYVPRKVYVIKDGQSDTLPAIFLKSVQGGVCTCNSRVSSEEERKKEEQRYGIVSRNSGRSLVC